MVVKWKGSGVNEIGVDEKNDRVLVKIDKNYYGPTEVTMLQGDYSKAEKLLNWKPKTNLEQLVKLMVKFDMEKIKRGA